ncbi:MAG: hypothetical protein SFV21_05260 [Rhodospirillaceae bacterium]|nr:hypothetical protein [Rhodospirillaceae bacterium]
MAKTKAQILDDMQGFIGRYGGSYKDWYVGTSNDPKGQLFFGHGFRKTDLGLYRQAGSELQAAEVAEFFTGMGAKGDDGVKKNADFVYAFRLAAHTKPGAARR